MLMVNLDTVEVGGSKPPVPTIYNQGVSPDTSGLAPFLGDCIVDCIDYPYKVII